MRVPRRGGLGEWVDDRAWADRDAPVAIVTVARTALVHDGDGGGDAAAPLEVSVRYLDGFGRALQEKVRVEAGPAIVRDGAGAVVVGAQGPVLAHAGERWRVSGHVVHDAKGQPVRVFEPYHSPSAAYEDDAVLAQFGVSTLTTYDALGRPERALRPDGAYERVAYGAWSTEAASASDTVLDSAYRALREGLAAGDAERAAYEHAASHANTPTITHVDARGAVCLTVAVGDATAGERRVRQVVDASGEVRATIDPHGLTAFTYTRDLRGRALATTSVDAGPSWTLPDAFDRPARAWDARAHRIVRSFDVADRPVSVQVLDGDGPIALDHVVETYRYGDQDVDVAAARAANTLGRVVEVRDGAGVTRTLAYDPAGAARARERRLRVDADDAPDWRLAVPVEAEALASAARTDLAGRVVWQRLVDGTERRDVFERGGGLASVRLTTPDGALVDAPLTHQLVRDAHGRVTAGVLGNGCVQAWRYDRDTGRLVAQDADQGGRALQRLRFTYDPDGKVVRALDLAQDGADAIVASAVSARRDFRYDAHGRLLEATGRVHQALVPHDYIPGAAGTISGTRHLSLNNGAALERYTQRFTYDVSGNLARMQHAGTTASWSTDFWIAAGSNRSLPAVDANGVPLVNPAAAFDATGNVVEQAHLRSMAWSWRGCLSRAVVIERPSGVADDERYAYGADRVRVRKLATRVLAGSVVETREVVYLGDQQRVQVRRDGTLVLERWTTHVGDGDRRIAVVDRHTIDTLAHEVDSIGPAKVRYHLTTPQGSTAIELDGAGGLVSYEEYLPHGGSAFLAGDDARDVARRDVRYAGQERDRATGLHAYPFRYYAPWLGRWLSPDPIGPADDLNLYQFVLGDPVGNVDPLGLDSRPGQRQVLDPDPAYADMDEATVVRTYNERHPGGFRLFSAHKEGSNWVADAWLPKSSVDVRPGELQAGFNDIVDDERAAGRVTSPATGASAPAVIQDPFLGEVALAPNQSYEASYGAIHARTTEDGRDIETITTSFGGPLGRPQFRIVDDSTGRHYQVFAHIVTPQTDNWNYQDVSRERFDTFRNFQYTFERDEARLRETLDIRTSTDYFSRVLSAEHGRREQFVALMRSTQMGVYLAIPRALLGPLEISWDIGVSPGEAMNGREASIRVDNVLTWDFGDTGRELTGSERLGRLKHAAVQTAAVALPGVALGWLGRLWRGRPAAAITGAAEASTRPRLPPGHVDEAAGGKPAFPTPSPSRAPLSLEEPMVARMSRMPPGSNLPGHEGIPISARPTIEELENLTSQHGVEFAVTYKLGPGTGGRGGQYYLHSGDLNSVSFPLESNRMFIYHTHPRGTPWASTPDRQMLSHLREIGSPQRSSQVIPVGTGTSIRFDTIRSRYQTTKGR